MTQCPTARSERSLDPGLRRHTNLGAWLNRILVNTFISNYRKSQRRNTILAEDVFTYRDAEALFAPRRDTQSAEREVIERFAVDELEQAIRDLPEPFRRALYLADVEDLSYPEIAEVLRLPLGTVRSRIHRGRRRLRTILRTTNSDFS